jgi:hypothetical protein
MRISDSSAEGGSFWGDRLVCDPREDLRGRASKRPAATLDIEPGEEVLLESADRQAVERIVRAR